MIRPATIEDYPQWHDLCYRLLKQTPYAGIEVDRASVAKIYGQCVSSRMGCVLVADSGKITGTIMGVAQELWWSRKRYATDLLFYSERPGDGIRLLRGFLDWAWALPSVAEVTLGQSSGIEIERTGLLYERLGLTKVGSIYTKTRELP